MSDDIVEYNEEEAQKVSEELKEVCVALENEGIDVENALKEFHVEIEEDLLEVSAIPAEVRNFLASKPWTVKSTDNFSIFWLNL